METHAVSKRSSMRDTRLDLTACYVTAGILRESETHHGPAAGHVTASAARFVCI